MIDSQLVRNSESNLIKRIIRHPVTMQSTQCKTKIITMTESVNIQSLFVKGLTNILFTLIILVSKRKTVALFHIFISALRQYLSGASDIKK